jgi:hypothetical protein
MSVCEFNAAVQQLEELNPSLKPACLPADTPLLTCCSVFVVFAACFNTAVVQQLERLNPTPKPLESPYLNGQWRLVSECVSNITLVGE